VAHFLNLFSGEIGTLSEGVEEASFKKGALPSWEIFRGQLGRFVTVEGLMGSVPMTSEELERYYAAGIQFEAALRN
jgi:hypothetical protein